MENLGGLDSCNGNQLDEILRLLPKDSPVVGFISEIAIQSVDSFKVLLAELEIKHIDVLHKTRLRNGLRNDDDSSLNLEPESDLGWGFLVLLRQFIDLRMNNRDDSS